MVPDMEFRRPSYFALASLIDGPLHGYAIIRRAGELSEGTVRLSTGTLYALLERAVTEGLVMAGEPYQQGGRQRRDYRLTDIGREQLLQEADRLAAASATVTERLRTDRGRPATGLARPVGGVTNAPGGGPLFGAPTWLAAGGPA
jgi:DNA-binding PadR family transcriptional regulator